MINPEMMSVLLAPAPRVVFLATVILPLKVTLPTRLNSVLAWDWPFSTKVMLLVKFWLLELLSKLT